MQRGAGSPEGWVRLGKACAAQANSSSPQPLPLPFAEARQENATLCNSAGEARGPPTCL